MNPLEKKKFDALIKWHNEHTVMDKETEAKAVKELNAFFAANPEAAAQFAAQMAADDAWNFPDGTVIPLGNETLRIPPADDTEAR